MSKKCWIYIVMAFLAIIPMVLFIVGKCDGNLLGYWGSLIGALATIIAVIMTINSNRNQQILATKPILQNDSKMITTKEQLDDIEEKVFLRYPFDNRDSVGSSDSLGIDIYHNKRYVNDKRYLVIQYSISNSGIGPAVDIKLSVNEQVAYPNFFLSNNMRKNFIIVTTLEKANKILNLKFEYTDMYGVFRYVQEDVLKVHLDDDNRLSVIYPRYGIGKARVSKYIDREDSCE